MRVRCKWTQPHTRVGAVHDRLFPQLLRQRTVYQRDRIVRFAFGQGAAPVLTCNRRRGGAQRKAAQSLVGFRVGNCAGHGAAPFGVVSNYRL